MCAVTEGYGLNCYHVIHTVGPVWGKDLPEVEIIKKAITESLLQAESLRALSVSLPAISCGIFSDGNKRNIKSTLIAIVQSIKEFNKKSSKVIKIIRLVVDGGEKMQIIVKELKKR